MRKFASYCVKKPITVLMSMLIIVVFGIYSLTRMSVSLFPDMNLPYAVIVTTYTGANPETVEEEVTIPIENSVSTLTNFSSLQSTSNEHYSMIMVIFNDDTNMDTAFLDMRESLDSISFADGVDKPRIMRISMDMMPVVSVSITKEFDNEMTDDEKLIATTQWVEGELMGKLNAINGVADVMVNGSADIVLSINYDAKKLLDYGLNATEVDRIVKESNIDGLVGITTDSDGMKMLYIGNAIDGLEELNNLPICYDEDDDKVITLKDLCREPIHFANDADQSYNKIDGKLGVTISFQQETSSELVEVVKNIHSALNDIKKEDKSIDYVVLLDQGEYVEQAVGTVVNNLIIGAVLAIFILLIFLRDIKPTLIVGISIPVSVIGTFALMQLSGVGLNIVSMGGLALGIGMLVDNSVVVIENIYRLLSEGKSKKEAAIEGVKEVVGAITASTLTTIAVFLPIMLISGMIGDVFEAMSLTITFSLLASLLIAITLVPSASARYLKNKETNEEKEGKIKQVYEKVLRWSLGHKAIVLSSVTVMFVLFAALAFTRGFILMPATDEGQISANIEFEQRLFVGDTFQRNLTFDEVADIADETSEKILEIDDVDVLSTSIGSGNIMAALLGGGGGTSTNISYTIILKENRKQSTKEVAKKIDKILNDDFQVIVGTDIVDLEIVDKNVSASDSTSMAFGTSGVQIYVKGNDMYELEAVANDLVAILESTKGIKKASNGISQGDDIVKIEVNKEEAIKLGLTAQQFQDAINLFYNGLGFSMDSGDAIKVEVDGVDYELSVSETGSLGDNMFIPYDYFLGLISVFDYETSKALENCEYKLYSVDYSMLDPELNPEFDLSQVISLNTKLGYTITETGMIFNEFATDFIDEEIEEGKSVDGKTWFPISKAVKTTMTGDCTTIEKQTGFTSISRDGKYRYLSVTAQYVDGYNPTKVSEEIDKKIDNYLASDDFAPFKKTVFLSEDGENEAIMEAVSQLLLAALVAILLVYMIMCIQFQSLKYPLIIMTTIPLAFTGGFIAILITGMEMSVVAIMGLVILVGIVVNNGIVIIDYMNQLIERGHKVFDAVIMAGKTRLRPIFMTASTTALALVPMALGFGDGGELLQPMAIATIGGMVYATLLTLVVVPAIYVLFNFRKVRKENEGLTTDTIEINQDGKNVEIISNENADNENLVEIQENKVEEVNNHESDQE